VKKSNTNSQLLSVKVNGLSEKINRIFEKETKGNTTFKVSKGFQDNRFSPKDKFTSI